MVASIPRCLEQSLHEEVLQQQGVKLNWQTSFSNSRRERGDPDMFPLQEMSLWCLLVVLGDVSF